MADWSTALINFTNDRGSIKDALTGATFDIYQGTKPASPDDAIVGTLLSRCTIASGALTAGIAPRWGLNCTVDGTFRPTINSVLIVPNSDVAATGTIATTLANVVEAINNYQDGYIKFKAWMNGTDGIIIEGPVNMGTAGNAWVLADGGTATTTVSTPTGATLGARAGVAHVNGLTVGLSSGRIMSTKGVWSGTNIATGLSQFFVIRCNPTDDDGTADTAYLHKRRIVGSCGTTSDADYVMSSTSLTIGRTHTIDTSNLTVNQSN